MIIDLSIARVEPELTHQSVDGHGFTLLSYVGLKNNILDLRPQQGKNTKYKNEIYQLLQFNPTSSQPIQQNQHTPKP